jgi:hypothetical protein
MKVNLTSSMKYSVENQEPPKLRGLTAKDLIDIVKA